MVVKGPIKDRMVFYLVINLSKATAVAWVQTVRNPAGERAVREEGSAISATASKQQMQEREK